MLTDKLKIEVFLNEYLRIEGDYTISDDGVIDVDGSVYLKDQVKFNQDGFIELPIQFGKVTNYVDFDYSKITNLKGFPHILGDFCSIINSSNLKSLNFSPKCKTLGCHSCDLLESLDYLNCEKFYGNYLNLKRFGTNFNAKFFQFTEFPTPTADEMRRFIQLNPEFETEQDASWITLIKDYYEHKDIFRAAQEFEILYNEPWIKPENKIEIVNSDLTTDFKIC